MAPGTERPDDRAAKQRRIVEERVKRPRDDASKARDAAKRSLKVSDETRKQSWQVRSRTLFWRHKPEYAGEPGGQVPPYGGESLHWQGEPDAQAFPAVQYPLSEQLDRELVGRNIRHAKDLTGVGQLELARRARITRQQMREYELGLVMPSVKNLAWIALALGFPIEWFLAEHDDQAPA